MGSGDWFKTIISQKKTKQDRSSHVKGSVGVRSNGFKLKNHFHKELNKYYHGVSGWNPGDPGMTIEDIAATRIQTAFRSFKARKILRSLKGIQHLQVLVQGHSVKKQASTTFSYLQFWSNIQAEIRARCANMVTEGRLRQKKKENQLKLKAKVHDLEEKKHEYFLGLSSATHFEFSYEDIYIMMRRWNGVEVLKRWRKFSPEYGKGRKQQSSMNVPWHILSHQWRANSVLNQGHFAYKFGKGNWRWSWVDRWIAAQPWETRLPAQSISPCKAQKKAASKAGKNTSPSTQRLSSTGKPPSADNGKDPTKKFPQPIDDNTASQEPKLKPASSFDAKAKNGNLKPEQQPLSQTVEDAGSNANN